MNYCSARYFGKAGEWVIWLWYGLYVTVKIAIIQGSRRSTFCSATLYGDDTESQFEVSLDRLEQCVTQTVGDRHLAAIRSTLAVLRQSGLLVMKGGSFDAN
jgi:hypothetical protein